MYGIAAALTYWFTFMGEITVYSDVGAWYYEFIVHLNCIMTTSIPIVWFMVGVYL